jgi:hypothetical protein
LVRRYPNWIGGERPATLKTGDYSVVGMEDVLAFERKSMADAIASTMAGRERFLASCVRLATFRWRGILIEATYEDMKTPYDLVDGVVSGAHPNAVCGTLDAIEAKFGIPSYLHVAQRPSGLRARGELAFKALHVLVAGATQTREGTNRFRRAVTSQPAST